MKRKIINMAKSKIRIKLISVVLSITAVLLLSVTGTFAYINYRTDTVSNKFDKGLINITVNENFEPDDITTEGIDKKVIIKNDSLSGQLNVADCYVRVNLVATWVNDDGTVNPVNADEMIDYTLNLTDDGWSKGDDGFYYYSQKLGKDESTTCLLEKVALKDNVTRPDSGHLEVNVLADAVSADKFETAWK